MYIIIWHGIVLSTDNLRPISNFMTKTWSVLKPKSFKEYSKRVQAKKRADFMVKLAGVILCLSFWVLFYSLSNF